MNDYGLAIASAGLLAALAVFNFRQRYPERVNGFIWGLQGLALCLTLVGALVHFAA